MEEFHQITIQEYLDWKEDLRRRLAEAANNFVGIGYRLKQIRDSKGYEQDGYTSIFDFSEKEFGISASQASRFMAINDKFSKGGNSLEMPEEFQKLGSSKLSEMLTLPQKDYQYIDENTTRDQIRELKDFEKQVNPPEENVQNTPESVPETAKNVSEPNKTSNIGEEPYKLEKEDDSLATVMWEYFRDKERIFDKCIKAAGSDTESFAKAMNPTGSALARKGTYMLFLKKPDKVCMMNVFGKNAPVEYSWDDIKAAFTDEFYGKKWADLFAPAQMKEPEVQKKPENEKMQDPAKPEKVQDGEDVALEESEENTDIEKGGDPAKPDKVQDGEPVAVEEMQEIIDTVETPEPANADKVQDGQAITITKSVDFAMSETQENAKELKHHLESMPLFDENTSAARLEDLMTEFQELTVRFLSSLQDWKKAAEREGR